MTGIEGPRAALLGALILVGATLLGVATLGLEWRYAPAMIRHPAIEWALGIVGLAVLLSASLLLALPRREPARTPAPQAPSDESSARTSLMTLPAILGNGAGSAAEPAPPITTSEPPVTTPAPAPIPARPSGLGAEGTSGSTLLIPFAEESRPASSPAEVPGAGETVTRLVDRIDTMQRVTPSSPSVAASPPVPETNASALLLRLTRIPNPPSTTSPFIVARRCSDCGESLGTPPHFEPCGDCHRALCERCYWRTSSGPDAHLCTACVKERSVPRPPTPALTFARPAPGASSSTVSPPILRPRRPSS